MCLCLHPQQLTAPIHSTPPPLQEVLDWFEDKGLHIYSISCGTSLVYNMMFPAHAKRLPQKMREVVETIAKVTIPDDRRHFDVVVACEGDPPEDGSEAEDPDVPLVSIRFR
jgi:ubiquitin-activating enzyme E1